MYAVHIQEVIKALRKEGIPMSLSSSTCRAGLAGAGQATIAASLALALSALLLAAFTFMRKPAVISETYTQYKRREPGTGGAYALVTPQPSSGAAPTVKHVAATRKLQDSNHIAGDVPCDKHRSFNLFCQSLPLVA